MVLGKSMAGKFGLSLFFMVTRPSSVSWSSGPHGTSLSPENLASIPPFGCCAHLFLSLGAVRLVTEHSLSLFPTATPADYGELSLPLACASSVNATPTGKSLFDPFPVEILWFPFPG